MVFLRSSFANESAQGPSRFSFESRTEIEIDADPGSLKRTRPACRRFRPSKPQNTPARVRFIPPPRQPEKYLYVRRFDAPARSASPFRCQLQPNPAHLVRAIWRGNNPPQFPRQGRACRRFRTLALGPPLVRRAKRETFRHMSGGQATVLAAAIDGTNFADTLSRGITATLHAEYRRPCRSKCSRAGRLARVSPA
jgi:hypothetical protein